MRLRKNWVPKNTIKKPYHGTEYVDIHGLAPVIVIVAGIIAVGVFIGMMISKDNNDYKTWRKECDIVSNGKPHFFTNPPRQCHVGPDWTTAPISL